ncbi:hypothetical protein B0H19DRAFT_1243256 [Mycena capillaripes]|nr:hypothetical protein B0H19DRAFT_1243256 [Mycena capillaripes]
MSGMAVNSKMGATSIAGISESAKRSSNRAVAFPSCSLDKSLRNETGDGTCPLYGQFTEIYGHCRWLGVAVGASRSVALVEGVVVGVVEALCRAEADWRCGLEVADVVVLNCLMVGTQCASVWLTPRSAIRSESSDDVATRMMNPAFHLAFISASSLVLNTIVKLSFRSHFPACNRSLIAPKWPWSQVYRTLLLWPDLELFQDPGGCLPWL